MYVHGVDGSVWKEVWSIARPADAVWGGALGTCLGAWFGAVPIPLDWYDFSILSYLMSHVLTETRDCPWQAFPITIVTGAYIGYAVGTFLGRSPFLYGKRIQFDSEEPEDKKTT